MNGSRHEGPPSKRGGAEKNFVQTDLSNTADGLSRVLKKEKSAGRKVSSFKPAMFDISRLSPSPIQYVFHIDILFNSREHIART